MKIKNKQTLMAFLRNQCSYDGKTELADVLAFLKEMDIAHDEADVKKVFAKSAALVLASGDDEIEEVPAEGDEPAAKSKSKKDADETEPEADGEDVKDELKKARAELATFAKQRKDEATRRAFAAAGHSETGTRVVRGLGAVIAKNYNIRANAGTVGFSDHDMATQFNAAMRLKTYELYQNEFPAHFANYKAMGFLAEDREIIEKDASDTIGTLGGFLLANVLKSEILYATEEWGVARWIARNEIMVGNNTSFSRKTAIPSFKPLSASAAQKGDISYDLVTLIPKVGALLILTPMVLFEQSATNLGDTIAETFMEAYWNTIDQCYFNGDGTSQSATSYFDIIGLANGLSGGRGTTTASTQFGSYYMAATNTVTTWTGADFLALMGVINNANTARACFIMSRQVYLAGPLRLATQATTGMMPDTLLSPANTYMTPNQQRGAAPGGPRAYLYGIPVYFSQIMSTKTASDAGVPKVYFGDFVTGSLVGHRTQLEIASSTDFAFDKRALATRGFAEFAVNICQDGKATSTLGGPIACMCPST